MTIQITFTDAALSTACILAGILYIAWLLHEVRIAVPEEELQQNENKTPQSHERNADEETPSSETKTQQEAQK